MTTPSEARASYEAIVAALTEVAARVEAKVALPDDIEADVQQHLAVLVPYLLGREPNGASERQVLDRYASRATLAVVDGDNADLCLYDGGYSRLLVRPFDEKILALSGVSRDEVKERWRAMFVPPADSPLRTVLDANQIHDQTRVPVASPTAGTIKAMQAIMDSPLRAETGVDAGTYSISKPLTVEEVGRRAGIYQRMQTDPHNEQKQRADLYRDVLRTIATDRGPLGDLARAALRAEE